MSRIWLASTVAVAALAGYAAMYAVAVLAPGLALTSDPATVLWLAPVVGLATAAVVAGAGVALGVIADRLAQLLERTPYV